MIVNRIINEDCLEGLKKLPDNSIDCCVTSPPYFGLRDYGHEGQIGLEETPEAYVSKMVEVFSEVKRVLKKEGTLWLNLGDSYAASGGKQVEQTLRSSNDFVNAGQNNGKRSIRNNPEGIKPKDLIGIPWMVAFALRSNDWYLRQDIIWHKPNPMPESVTDRCTKSHEYIFLLSKSAKYYYDNAAIGTMVLGDTIERYKRGWNGNGERGFPNGPQNHIKNFMDPGKDKREWANKKSVWSVNTYPYSEAHFATFPEDLIVDCIRAGCPENGIVLDPFMGAGTTALVSAKLNRKYVGFELNAEYVKIAEKRLKSQLGMFMPNSEQEDKRSVATKMPKDVNDGKQK